jgi:hypothetical protein
MGLEVVVLASSFCQLHLDHFPVAQQSTYNNKYRLSGQTQTALNNLQTHSLPAQDTSQYS